MRSTAKTTEFSGLDSEFSFLPGHDPAGTFQPGPKVESSRAEVHWLSEDSGPPSHVHFLLQSLRGFLSPRQPSRLGLTTTSKGIRQRDFCRHVPRWEIFRKNDDLIPCPPGLATPSRYISKLTMKLIRVAA